MKTIIEIKKLIKAFNETNNYECLEQLFKLWRSTKRINIIKFLSKSGYQVSLETVREIINLQAPINQSDFHLLRLLAPQDFNEFNEASNHKCLQQLFNLWLSTKDFEIVEFLSEPNNHQSLEQLFNLWLSTQDVEIVEFLLESNYHPTIEKAQEIINLETSINQSDFHLLRLLSPRDFKEFNETNNHQCLERLFNLWLSTKDAEIISFLSESGYQISLARAHEIINLEIPANQSDFHLLRLLSPRNLKEFNESNNNQYLEQLFELWRSTKDAEIIKFLANSGYQPSLETAREILKFYTTMNQSGFHLLGLFSPEHLYELFECDQERNPALRKINIFLFQSEILNGFFNKINDDVKKQEIFYEMFSSLCEPPALLFYIIKTLRFDHQDLVEVLLENGPDLSFWGIKSIPYRHLQELITGIIDEGNVYLFELLLEDADFNPYFPIRTEGMKTIKVIDYIEGRDSISDDIKNQLIDILTKKSVDVAGTIVTNADSEKVKRAGHLLGLEGTVRIDLDMEGKTQKVPVPTQGVRSAKAPLTWLSNKLQSYNKKDNDKNWLKIQNTKYKMQLVS